MKPLQCLLMGGRCLCNVFICPCVLVCLWSLFYSWKSVLDPCIPTVEHTQSPPHTHTHTNAHTLSDPGDVSWHLSFTCSGNNRFIAQVRRYASARRPDCNSSYVLFLATWLLFWRLMLIPPHFPPERVGALHASGCEKQRIFH